MKILSFFKGFVTNSSSANYWLNDILRDEDSPPTKTEFNANNQVIKKTYHDYDDARIIMATLYYEYNQQGLLEKEVHHNAKDIVTKEIYYNDQEEIAREVYYNNESGIKEEIVDHETGQNIYLVEPNENMLSRNASQELQLVDRTIQQDNLIQETANTLYVWLCLSGIIVAIIIIRLLKRKPKQ